VGSQAFQLSGLPELFSISPFVLNRQPATAAAGEVSTATAGSGDGSVPSKLTTSFIPKALVVD
jgi:hypothetical protein